MRKKTGHILSWFPAAGRGVFRTGKCGENGGEHVLCRASAMPRKRFYCWISMPVSPEICRMKSFLSGAPGMIPRIFFPSDARTTVQG